jgi:hypothetical protein
VLLLHNRALSFYLHKNGNTKSNGADRNRITSSRKPQFLPSMKQINCNSTVHLFLLPK